MECRRLLQIRRRRWREANVLCNASLCTHWHLHCHLRLNDHQNVRNPIPSILQQIPLFFFNPTKKTTLLLFRYLLVGLGGKNYLNLPFLEWKLPKLGTPYIAIFIVGGIQIMCLFVPFGILVEIMNVFYCCVIIVICLSFLNLRRKNYVDDLPRVFRAANSTFTKYLVGCCPIVISVFLIATSVVKSIIPIVSAAGCAFVLSIVYVLRKRCEKRRTPKETIN